jgi:hypothetical protein
MRVGIAKITLHLGCVSSLKDKRRVLQSLIAHTKREFNVSIAEVEQMDNRERTVLGVALVSNNGRLNQRVLDKLVAFLERHPEVSVEHVESEIL